MERHNIRHVYLPAAETWIWESDGRVVGFISLLESEVGGLFVDPDFQRAGIGQALVDHARGLRGALEVEVFEKNGMARAFYEKLGFEVMHHKVHNETGLELIRLRLDGESST